MTHKHAQWWLLLLPLPQHPPALTCTSFSFGKSLYLTICVGWLGLECYPPLHGQPHDLGPSQSECFIPPVTVIGLGMAKPMSISLGTLSGTTIKCLLPRGLWAASTLPRGLCGHLWKQPTWGGKQPGDSDDNISAPIKIGFPLHHSIICSQDVLFFG